MSNSSTDRRVPLELFPDQPALRLYDCVVEALRIVIAPEEKILNKLSRSDVIEFETQEGKDARLTLFLSHTETKSREVENHFACKRRIRAKECPQDRSRRQSGQRLDRCILALTLASTRRSSCRNPG